ncbi:SpoIIE family protein phosphatase [Streptomyces sp. NPDC090306]|uniref:SpoIIE family protein phosphatase n=1 Tax=Streptomyces sp. NPDC090306 TaxID=3365961 RepID=UPI00380C71AD
MRSVVGRMFVLQLVTVLLLVVGAVVGVVLTVQRDAARSAASQSRSVAETFAHAPDTVAALQSSDPSSRLQSWAEQVGDTSEVDFISVFDRGGIRLANTTPELVGSRVDQDVDTVLEGKTSTGRGDGPRGASVRTVVPVVDAKGKVLGAVAVGVREASLGAELTRQLPTVLGTGALAVLVTVVGAALISRGLLRQTRGLGPAEITRMYEHHDAVLHATREGVVIVDSGRRVMLVNDEARRLLGLPEDAQGRQVRELDMVPPIAELLVSGREVSDEVHAAGGRLLAVNQRSLDRYGVPAGTVTTLRDSTELQALSGQAEAASERLKVLYDASVTIGTTLDVRRTAEELAEVAVPRFADAVTVDLADSVLNGEEPVPGAQQLRRTVSPSPPGKYGLRPVGEHIHFAPSSPQARAATGTRAVVEATLGVATGPWTEDTEPEQVRRVVEEGMGSLVTAPLRTAGVVVGVVNFWRRLEREAFDEDDATLAEELATRTAVCIENARRYTREHVMAVSLQRSLLPRTIPDQDGLDVAYRYLPAQAGVGGDWFDVIPLPGARVALVVGDVVGHGLHAAATMGRLRTAVRNFSSLDLPPDELLARLDELTSDSDTSQDTGEPYAITGATCLYAVYDPVEGRCTVATAGHPPPVLLRPDGTAEILDVPPGPPLGIGGLPFTAHDVDVPDGSRLALFTDGLFERRDRDIDVGLETLRRALTLAGDDLDAACGAVVDVMLPGRPGDDVVLVLAHAHTLPAYQVAHWDVPPDPEAVRHVRAAVDAKLTEWGLEDVGFVTELVLSELVTNAIRHAAGPISLRLLLDRSLICEVFDASSTTPHLRYAETMDEGGRGLFLVSQFASRWGVRYTPDGKIIWTEQQLPSGYRPPSAPTGTTPDGGRP